ncbi:hypothetical protein [Desulfosoma sp.]|uniref:hypothetical protein n=1 Tax=Desulfosoma sp. TaxID=2603217 RepID=UPI00404AF48A
MVIVLQESALLESGTAAVLQGMSKPKANGKGRGSIEGGVDRVIAKETVHGSHGSKKV